MALRSSGPAFLERPVRGLQAFAGRPATYRDASAASVALLSGLTAADLGEPSPDPKRPLLPVGGARFWTERAERNWLPSLGAVVGLSRENLQRIGRWAADTSETYVRTTRAIVESSQLAVARALADPSRARSFDDGGVLDAFAKHLVVKCGFSDAVAGEAASRLIWPAGGDRPSAPAVGNHTPQLDEKPGVKPGAPPSRGGAPQEAAAADPDTNPAPEGYVVSVTGAAKLRRLHFVGRCWRLPGVHYTNYIAFGLAPPPPAAYAAVCRSCWRVEGSKPEVVGTGVAAPSSSDSSGSSSSSSSSSESAA